MHIAFLGGTRFIGPAAARHAHARGHEVTFFHRGVTPAPSDVAFARDVIVDRREPTALATALARARPDVVVDTWAMAKADAEVLALCMQIVPARWVVLSSQDVYAQFGALNGLPAPPPEALVTEDSALTIPRPFATLGPHEGGPDYDKKDVEHVLRLRAGALGARVVVLRLPGVYGTGDPKRRFGAIIDALDAAPGVDVEIPCAAGRSLRLTHAHVADVAHAIVSSAEANDASFVDAAFTVFNVGERDVPTMRERAAALGTALGKAIRFVEQTGELPSAFGLFGTFPNDCVMDTSRIRDRLGFDEVTTEAGRISDLVGWLRTSRP